MSRTRVVIAGAAGRDFHDFNVVFRGDAAVEVVAFTATQIPNIDGRRYPAALAGPLYPEGIPILPESELAELVRERSVDEVVFAYSDVTHEHVMHLASRALAAGAGFRLLAPAATELPSSKPVVAVCAVRTGGGQEPDDPLPRAASCGTPAAGSRSSATRCPTATWRARPCSASRRYEDLDAADCTIEEREEYEPHIDAGHVVYAGVDYGAILARAEERPT